MGRVEKKEKLEKKEFHPGRKLMETLKLPKDMMTGASIVTVIGKEEVLVENYRGIIEYSSESIVLQGKNCRIMICGCRLFISYYTNEDMKIEGMISLIKYL